MGISHRFNTHLTDCSPKSFVPIYATTSDYGRRIDDALHIDITHADSEHNTVGYVYSGKTISLPSDCYIGIREVYFYNSSNIIVKITGWSANNYVREWFNIYNGTTWLGWYATTMTAV